MGLKWCVTGEMTLGPPQQSVTSICIRGNNISKTYLIYRWCLAIIILFVTIFSFTYYQVPLFNTQYDPKLSYANTNMPKCCVIYWIFYISSWYLLASTYYISLLIYLQCIVKTKYYEKSSDIDEDNNYKPEVALFTKNFNGLLTEGVFQMMRLAQLFSVSTSTFYMIIYWTSINDIHSDSFKNINNPSDLGEIINSVPISFFVVLLQNTIIPVLICIDFFTNCVWYKYPDSIAVFLIMICYACTLFAHFMSELTNEFGDPYIYYQLNFNNSLGGNFGASLIMCVVWIIVITGWSNLLILIKKQLILRWIKTNSGLIAINMNVPFEDIDTDDAATPHDIV